MSLSLPLSGSALRETFEVADLADPAAVRRLPSFAAVCSGLRRTVASGNGIVGAAGLALRASGDIVLVQCGPRGGCRAVWTFGRLGVDV